MVQDRIVLVGLDPAERRQIDRLLASFDINVVGVEPAQATDTGKDADPDPISLIVVRIDPAQQRPERDIARLRLRYPPPIPLLMLIPEDRIPCVPACLKAGADDYWVLPLDDTVFPTRFYVLLECGQAAAFSGAAPHPPENRPEDSGASVWRRILDRFQDGFGFFSSTRMVRASEDFCLLDRWTKIREIGSGGFGSVWQVRDEKTGRIAVAKIPHHAHLNLRVLRSAAILKRLGFHPNVAQLIDVVKQSGRIILILEYVPGQTLQARLEKGMSSTEKETCFLQLLTVVGHAHQHKIIHQDIKPDNVMLTDDNTLKLLDFGIARDLSRLTISGAGFGTRAYMSPEQILGKSCMASDVWALGVLLYILATNAHPFYHSNEKYMMDAILEAPPPPPTRLVPEIPARLESIILTCLEKTLEKRYPDAVRLRTVLTTELPEFGRGTCLPLLPPL